MGMYVNPSNTGFSMALRSEYVDKTGLVTEFDKTLESKQKLVLVSRPRRFGKSYAAQMLTAFYSCGCDSRSLFEGREVAKANGWDAHLNQYHVVSLDMTEIIQAAGVDHVVEGIEQALLPELRAIRSDAGLQSSSRGSELKNAFLDVVRATGKRFVFVIDEWDAPYRLAQGVRTFQDDYAEWLRALFKGLNFTDEVVAGAYLTGILPMKKYAHQSAVSDFWEYTMVRPGPYAPYAGFTEDEVKVLCAKHGLDLDDMRRWYDGYDLPKVGHVYAPYSVMHACQEGETGSYWVATEAYESLRPFIEMDFDGLQQDLVQVVGGAEVEVDPDGFQNDMDTILAKDDVLALLIHLGYLTYDAVTRTARVPNEEVRLELARSIKRSHHPELVQMMSDSVKLLDDLVAMREEAVAEGIQRVHDRDTSPLFYNNEQALRAVVKTALVAAVDEYARIEELPGGKGYADVVYLPRRQALRPAIIVELKWNKPVDAAIAQIRERNYPDALRGLDVPILLVGITYDPDTHKHECKMVSM